MNRKMLGKRIGCAALAAQMLATPMAQAAAPFGEMTREAFTSLAENRLAWGSTERSFPRLSAGITRLTELSRANAVTSSSTTVAEAEAEPDSLVEDEVESAEPEEDPNPEENPTSEEDPNPEETEEAILPQAALKRNRRGNQRGTIGSTSSGDDFNGVDFYVFFGFGENYRSPDKKKPTDENRYSYESEDWKKKREEEANDSNSFESDAFNTYYADFLKVYSDTYVKGSQGEIYFDFTGTLPGKEELPRLPDLEFSGKWYLLGFKFNPDDKTILLNDRSKLSEVVAFSSWSEALSTQDGNQTEKIIPNIVYDENWDKEELTENTDLEPYINDRSYIGSQYDTTDYTGIVYGTDAANGDTIGKFPIIAKWQASSNATLTGLELKYSDGQSDEAVNLYTVADNDALAALKAKTFSELGAGAEFDTGKTDYFVRLPAAAETLQFTTLQAYEPSSEVTIRATYGDETSVQVSPLVNVPTPKTDNSYANPARSNWWSDENKNPVSVDMKKDGKSLSKLTITVTAPDGTSTEGYTVHVQQLQEPEMKLEPGNTPMGMIERNQYGDSTGEDLSWTTQKKEEATTYFKNNYKFYDVNDNKVYAPADSIHNNGGYLWGGIYQSNAWTSDIYHLTAENNLDLDPGTIVVYQNSTFQIPGVTVTKANGEAANFDNESSNPGTLTWSLKVTVVDELGPSAITATGREETLAYTEANGVVTFSLEGKNVKPGVYNLSYTYEDPYDGVTHAGGSFVRRVVVLPLHGDVDMDGVVTTADGTLLKKLVSEGFFDDVQSTEGNYAKRLYAYRVCDIDGNGAVNAVDVNKLLEGYFPQITNGQRSDYFYLPLPGDKTKTAVTVETKNEAPSIGLNYLGKGTDVANLDRTSKLNCNDSEATVANSVFWMEVKLDGAPAALQDPLTSVTLTLVYDSDYVKPYVPAGKIWADYIAEQNSGWTLTGATDVTPVDHASKGVNTLGRDGMSLSGKSSLREIRITLTPTTDSVTLSTLTNGSLLKIPFQMVSIPFAMKNVDTRLVELVLGGRDLVVTTTSASAVWDNDTTRPTASVTTNLKEMLNYRGSEALPIGEDKTPCQYVYKYNTTDNWVYGGDSYEEANPYGVTSVDSPQVVFPNGEIKWEDKTHPDCTYDATGSKKLEIKPTMAGTFCFSFEGDPNQRFAIKVEKAPLDLTVKDVVKYYGETETTEKVFTYDVSQIANRDKTGSGALATSNSGSMTDLAKLDGYSAPAFKLATDIDGNNAVDSKTAVGEYYVLLTGGETANYKFRYVQSFTKGDTTGGGTATVSEKTGTAKLTILPRPILVKQVTKTLGPLLENHFYAIPVGEETADQTGLTFETVTVDSNGYYDGKAPLTATTAVVEGDTLTLNYGATVTRTTEDQRMDTGGVKYFALTLDEEERDAVITNITLAETATNGNYVLLNAVTTNSSNEQVRLPQDTAAKVTIKRRELKSLTLVEPQKTPGSYTYGETLSLIGFRIQGEYADESKATAVETVANVKDPAVLGLNVQWVSEKGQIPDASCPDVLDNEQLNVADHNGKYICLWSGEQRCYIGPFHVEPKVLTLTIQGESRYYGEEVDHWSIRYDHSQLSAWDQIRYPNTTGLIEDLDGIITNLSTIQEQSVLKREGTTAGSGVVTETSNIGSYYVLLRGVESVNYQFEYVRTEYNGTTSRSTQWGYAPLKVLARPILVTAINDALGLYHDSTSYQIDPAEATLGNDAAGYVAVLPEAFDANDPTTVYYTADGSRYTVGLKLTNQSVYSGESLTVQYQAEFLNRDDDNQPPFYHLRDDEPVRSVPVQIAGLKLKAGGTSGNYQLLFSNTDAAYWGWLSTSTEKENSRTTGTIYQREIVGLEITADPKLSYTYGVDKLNLSGMKIKVTYDGENGTQIVKEVSYEYKMTTDSFKELGITLHWGAGDGEEAQNGQVLSVAKYDGKQLYVAGPNYPGKEPVTDCVKTPVTVAKKTLTLTVADATRYYGEENPEFKFTFNTSDLSDEDKSLVASLVCEGTNAGGTVTSAALAALNTPYEDGQAKNELVLPEFGTAAGKKSPVNNETPYTIQLSGGSMANYTFAYVDGGLTIKQRPIHLVEIASSAEDPLCTISVQAFGSGSSATSSYTLQGLRVASDKLTFEAASPLTGKTGLVSGDSVAVTMKVKYDNWSDSEFGTAYEVKRAVLAFDFSLEAGGDNANYVLEANNFGINATGAVQKRNIVSIEIQQLPSKMEYTYGETLINSDMLIKITYDEGDAERVRLGSLNGLAYAYYWDEEAYGNFDAFFSGLSVTDRDAILEDIIADNKYNGQAWYPAQNGDHLTIAGNGSTGKEGFAHNGKKIFVFARTHETIDFVMPVLTSKAVTVNPLELTYTLAADDKVYDGTTDATGTITLTNVYGSDEVSLLPATFTFVDENVNYEEAEPEEDYYWNAQPIAVEVTDIAIDPDGHDAANYTINSEVLVDTVHQVAGRDTVPYATITPKERAVPEITTNLWVDEHTNRIEVRVTPATPVGDEGDEKNSELHYEYALVYKDESGALVKTAYQDSPYFGGEDVSLDAETLGGLPRGTYFGAMVRLSQTNNYNASLGSVSFGGVESDSDETLLAALDAAVARAEAAELPEPEDEKTRQAERVPGPVIKTYTQRIELVSVTEAGEGDSKVLIPGMVTVWFTDVEEFRAQENLSRVLDNLTVTRYYGYYWDVRKEKSVQFPLTLTEEVRVEVPVDPNDKDSAKVETVVCGNGTVRIYVATKAVGGGYVPLPQAISIWPQGLEMIVGDEETLEATIAPSELNYMTVRWSSSDETVATVSKDGVVTAVGAGTATITAELRTYKLSDSIQVTVKLEEEPKEIPYQDTMFNAGYDQAFMELFNGCFEPEREMTRRELAIVIAHFFQPVEGKTPGTSTNYVDISPDDPCYEAVKLLDMWGIVKGTVEPTSGVGYFAPDRTVTRAEIATILCRMLMLPLETEPDRPHAFKDSEPGKTWAWSYIDALARANISKGTGHGYYSPEKKMTRAEMATFLTRMLVTRADETAETLLRPIDVPKKHWAYEFILRAINGAPAVKLSEGFLTRDEAKKKYGSQ